MLRTRATGLLSGSQMTVSPFSSAPVATTSCSDEPSAVSHQGLGLGFQLLRDAILNSLKVSELAGARALVVDPAGEAASAFCRRFGFSDLLGTTRMVLRLI